jgi:hypothetical protein
VGDVSVRFLYIGFNHRVKVIEHNYYTKKKKKFRFHEEVPKKLKKFSFEAFLVFSFSSLCP